MTTSIPSPPTPVAPLEKTVTRPIVPLPKSLTEQNILKERISFDPAVHLNYKTAPGVMTMKDIGYEGYGISPVAVSEPFPLFTEDAINQMRAEAFTPEVLDNCLVSSSFAKHMIRAYAPKYATFAWEAWHNGRVQAIVSDIAGVELVPTLPCDVGHINVSFGLDDKSQPGADDTSAFKWHFDSTPFVCVTMLSDCTQMIGGETVIKTASGEIIKVRGPTMGTAVIMQGRYIEHQALKAFGGKERLAMVTAWRPKSPFISDQTVLAGIRGITEQNSLYYWFCDYRFDNMEARFREERRKILARQREGLEFDIDATREFLEEQQRTIKLLLDEVVYT
ncbi:hypothetical protein AALT_g11940 [Alternaria alternata]|nr:hypothetical protein AALT_g11940 [Alternaria alternata]